MFYKSSSKPQFITSEISWGIQLDNTNDFNIIPHIPSLSQLAKENSIMKTIKYFFVILKWTWVITWRKMINFSNLIIFLKSYVIGEKHLSWEFCSYTQMWIQQNNRNDFMEIDVSSIFQLNISSHE